MIYWLLACFAGAAALVVAYGWGYADGMHPDASPPRPDADGWGAGYREGFAAGVLAEQRCQGARRQARGLDR